MPKKRWLLVLSVAIFISFVYFSYLVHKNIFKTFDFDTTVKLQDHIPRRFDGIFSLFSLFGSAEITSLIWIILSIWALVKKKWLTLISLMLFIVALTVELFGKFFLYHPGPPFMFFRTELPFNFPSSYIATHYSYPSGHATRTTFLVTFLAFFCIGHTKGLKRALLLCLLGVFLVVMCVSRVYLGEHWSTDVIGGTLLGISLGLLPSLTLKSKNP